MFQEKIAQQYARLGRNQKKIADFLTLRYREAAFINALSLSQLLAVDPATVTRFAQRLGYAGYPELLHEIQEAVKRELGVAPEPSWDVTDESGMFFRALAHERENLERAPAHIRGETIAAVLSSLRSAENIYVVAHGLARGAAHTFVTCLHDLIDMPVRMVPADEMDAAVALSRVSAHDIVVGVSLAATLDKTADILRLARSRGAKTIGLATSHTSPTASNADLVLVCPAESAHGMPSASVLSAILSALFQALAMKHAATMEDVKEGLLTNMNWILTERGDRRMQESEVLRQL